MKKVVPDVWIYAADSKECREITTSRNKFLVDTSKLTYCSLSKEDMLSVYQDSMYYFGKKFKSYLPPIQSNLLNITNFLPEEKKRIEGELTVSVLSLVLRNLSKPVRITTRLTEEQKQEFSETDILHYEFHQEVGHSSILNKLSFISSKDTKVSPPSKVVYSPYCIDQVVSTYISGEHPEKFKSESDMNDLSFLYPTYNEINKDFYDLRICPNVTEFIMNSLVMHNKYNKLLSSPDKLSRYPTLNAAYSIYNDKIVYTITGAVTLYPLYVYSLDERLRDEGFVPILTGQTSLFTSSISYKFYSASEAEWMKDFFMRHKNSLPLFNLLTVSKHLYNSNTQLYSKITLRKASGKIREVYNPTKELKIAERIFLKHWLTPVYLRSANRLSFAYTKKKSCIQAAVRHRSNKYMISIDFKKYFDSISRDLLEKKLFFITNSLTPEEKDLFFRVVINPETQGIYQGSPLSGIFCNYASSKFITSLKNILEQQNPDENFEVSIYADDIIISANKRIHITYILQAIDYLIRTYKLPFKINPEKIHARSNQRRRVLGYSINHKNELVKSKRYRGSFNFRALLHKIAIGEVDATKLMPTILGKINEVLQAEYKNLKPTGISRYLDKLSNLDSFPKNVKVELAKAGVQILEWKVQK
jgi:hypothetical protein